MKQLALLVLAAATVMSAQQPAPQPTDPNAPALTLEEKISLTTDDVKKADALESAQKAWLATQKPIQDHQDATKAVIEKQHPGWSLENGPQGWHLVKKPEPTKAEAPKPAKPEKK